MNVHKKITPFLVVSLVAILIMLLLFLAAGVLRNDPGFDTCKVTEEGGRSFYMACKNVEHFTRPNSSYKVEVIN